MPPSRLRIRSAARGQTASAGTHRSRSSAAGRPVNGDMPHGLKCTPASRTRAGYSKTNRLVHRPMNHASANTAGGTEGSESRRPTGPRPRWRNRCADGIGGTFIRRCRGTPVRQ
jgi:hypothetical protein